MRAAAFAVLAFAFMFIGAGLIHGLTDVRIDNGTSCGSAFSVDDSVEDDILDESDTRREQCDAARADIAHLSAALVVGGVVGAVMGVIGFSVSERDGRKVAQTAGAHAAEKSTDEK